MRIKLLRVTELVGETKRKTVELGETKYFMEAIRAALAEGKGKYQSALHEFALDNFCMEHNIETYLDVIKELSKKV